MTDPELNCWRDNWNKIVLEGRKPGLTLTTGCEGETLTQAEWGLQVMGELKQLAKVMDQAVGDHRYETVCDKMITCFDNPELTLSGRVLADVIAQGGIGGLGLSLARDHKAALADVPYNIHSDADFLQEAKQSVARQKAVEDSDTQSFEAFLNAYFKDVPMAESW
jgi:Gamma-glutamylcysteine synthetase